MAGVATALAKSTRSSRASTEPTVLCLLDLYSLRFMIAPLGELLHGYVELKTSPTI